MKQCNTCGLIKPVTEFSKQSKNKDGLRYSCKMCDNEYYQKNLDRIRKRQSGYRKANKDLIAERNSNYYQANAYKINDYTAGYYRDNIDRITEQRAKYKQTQEGKATKARYKAKRRAALEATECTLTANEWAEIVGLYHGLCAYCGVDLGTTQDHVIPLVPRQGEPRGTHTRDNVVPACKSCNSSKCNKPVEVWKPGWKPLSAESVESFAE